MKAEDKNAITGVFCEVVETLAFMFADPADKEDIETDSPECIKVRMSFSGAKCGRLELAAHTELCAQLTANVLGLDLDDALVRTQADDALKELLNVTCGNLLTALAGQDPVFDLSLPEIAPLDEAGWRAFLEDDDTLAFDVDDNPVLLRFSMEG